MFKIAWRNLWRNRTRTVVSILAIVISLGLYLSSLGVGESSYREMERSAAQAAGGTIIIHADGWWEEQGNDQLLRSPAELLAGLQDLGYTPIPNVVVQGLLSTARGTAMVSLQGMDLQRQETLQPIRDLLIQGSFPTGDDAGLVLGKKLAELLDVDLDDRVILTAAQSDGELGRALFHVRGIVSTGLESMDSAIAWTTNDAAAASIRAKGSLTKVGLVVTYERRFEVRDQILPLVPDGAVAVTWDEAMPDMVGFIDMDKGFQAVYGLLIFLVVVFAVLNTFLMIVMERVREFGLVSALGLTPRQVARLLVTEAILLSIVSVVLGFLFGFCLHLVLAHVGIDFSGFGELEYAGVGLVDTVIRSEFAADRWLTACVWVFGLVIVASIYPAYKAGRLTPSEAMRFYE